MTSATGDTNLAIYSDLVSKAVKLAKRFAEFTCLLDADQVFKKMLDSNRKICFQFVFVFRESCFFTMWIL